MRNIHTLGVNVTIKGQVNPDVVEVLSGLLEQAKAGEIIDFAYVGISPADSYAYGHCRGDKSEFLIAGLCDLKGRLLENVFIGR